MRTVKDEHGDYSEYPDFEDAYQQLKHWLEVVYMTMHSRSVGLCHTAQFKATHAWVGDDAGSDHLPVLADLVWTP